MDPSVAAAAAAKETDASDVAIQNRTVSDDDVKVEDEPGHEAETKPSEATGSGASKPRAERHDSVIPEDNIDPGSPSALTENVKLEAHQAGSSISGDTSAATEPNAADFYVPSTEKKLDLGSSILQTPSTGASSKSSPTASSQLSPKLGNSPFKTPSLGAPSNQASPSPKTAGSTWVWNYGGKPWPVVLCDEQTMPKKFMETRRKDSHLPAVLLGQRKFIWTVDSLLEFFVRDGDYLQGSQKFDTDDLMPKDSEEDKFEKLRQKAFRIDVGYKQDHLFWMNAVEQDAQARKLRRHMGDVKVRPIKESNTTKRKMQDEADAAKTKRRKTTGKATAHERDDGEEEEMDSEDKLFVDEEEEEYLNGGPHKYKSQEQVDAEQAQYQANHRNSWARKEGACTILVGEGEDVTPFKVPNSALGQSAVLTTLIRYADEKNGDTYIKLNDAHKIEASEFKPVATWLNKGSISPHVIKGPKGRAVIEGIHTREDAEEATKRFANVYYTAARFHLSGLQKHCVDKLHVLPATTSLGMIWATVYFNGAKVHGWSSELKMEEWLASRIALQFWDMVSEEGFGLRQILQDSPHLRMSVLDRVAGLGRLEEEAEDLEEDWESRR